MKTITLSIKRNIIISLFFLFSFNSYSQWQQVSPIDTINAATYCMASQDSMMYIGTNHGLYISRNNGNTWFNYLTNIKINYIAIHDNIVLVSDSTTSGYLSCIYYSLNSLTSRKRHHIGGFRLFMHFF